MKKANKTILAILCILCCNRADSAYDFYGASGYSSNYGTSANSQKIEDSGDNILRALSTLQSNETALEALISRISSDLDKDTIAKINIMMQMIRTALTTISQTVQSMQGLTKTLKTNLQNLTGNIAELKMQTQQISQGSTQQQSSGSTAIKSVAEKAQSLLSWLPGGSILGSLISGASALTSGSKVDDAAAHQVQADGQKVANAEHSVNQQIQQIETMDDTVKQVAIDLKTQIQQVLVAIKFAQVQDTATQSQILELLNQNSKILSDTVEPMITQITNYTQGLYTELQNKHQEAGSVVGQAQVTQRKLENEEQARRNTTVQQTIQTNLPQVQQTLSQYGSKLFSPTSTPAQAAPRAYQNYAG